MEENDDSAMPLSFATPSLQSNNQTDEIHRNDQSQRDWLKQKANGQTDL